MTKEERKVYNKNYNRSEIGVISCIYKTQRDSSKRRKHPMPTYTKQELSEWLYKNNFKVLFDNWVLSKYDKYEKPSVDRLDDKQGYSLNNIQLITWRENDLKAKTYYIGKAHKDAKPKVYYETKAVTRSNFKITCKRMNWNFNEFIETTAEREKWTLRKDKRKIKRYYYKAR